MRARLFAFFVTIAAINAPITSAFAQQHGGTTKQRLDEAMPHFNKAVELYDENDFSGALVEFRRAYEISQDFKVLFNVAQTYYQTQNYAGALDAFQRYLTEGGANVVHDRRTYVEKEIQRLKGRVAQVRVTVNIPNADILVDDEKVGSSPLDHPLVVSQGKRKITASVQGKAPASKTIEVAGGDATAISLEIGASGDGNGNGNTNTGTGTTPPVTPPVVVETRRKIPWAVWGVTGGLAAVWIGTGVIALIFKSQVDSKLNTYGATADDIASAKNGAKDFALVSDITLGCTIVGVGVATILTLIAKPEPVEKDHVTTLHGITAHVVASPTSIGLVGSF